MSVAAATRQAFAVEAKNSSPTFQAAAASPAVESAIERISSWVPTETIAIYVTLIGLFAFETSRARWVMFAIGLISVPVFVFLNGAIVNKRGAAKWQADGNQGSPPKITRRQLLLIWGLATAAFVGWAMVLPATPFLSWFANATRVGGVIVIVLSPLIPKIAEVLDLTLPTT